MNPNATEAHVATAGTPPLLTVANDFGASPRSPSENAIRDAVYSPEFRHDSTAVSTTTSITVPAYGMFSDVSTATYGLLETARSFHGNSATITAIDPM